MRHMTGAQAAAYQRALSLVAGTPAFQHLVGQQYAQMTGGRAEIVGRGWPGHDHMGQEMTTFSTPTPPPTSMPVPPTGGCSPLNPAGCGNPCWPGSMVPGTYGGPGVAYGSVPYVADIPFTEIREQTLGFFQSGIAAGTQVAVISRPQIVFRGERLVVPSTVAPNFTIQDIRIGNRSQLANSTGVPAQMFIESAVGVRLSLDTAQISQDVAIEVINNSNTNVTFQAALIGTIAQ